ncbi:MAG: heme-binding protein, partial [Allorhizobium sp.]
EGTGVVAAITVSGLKSEEDHAMIVTVLEAYLGSG